AWAEVLNTDASSYGGTGVGNLGTVEAVAAGPLEANAPGGSPAYATLVLPPLATLWLRSPAGG
ncbi:alpha amylase C-terminal domain-containing protein, partial [Nocardioides sp. GCM10030258]